jgi:ditrans,polycis-polyprenyl diphosphate synthase
MQWLWEYILYQDELKSSFPPLQSGLKRLQNSCIAAIRRGPVPQHLAIIMDGNRRFARSNRIDTAEGHYTGAETLKNVKCPEMCC